MEVSKELFSFLVIKPFSLLSWDDILIKLPLWNIILDRAMSLTTEHFLLFINLTPCCSQFSIMVFYEQMFFSGFFIIIKWKLLLNSKGLIINQPETQTAFSVNESKLGMGTLWVILILFNRNYAHYTRLISVSREVGYLSYLKGLFSISRRPPKSFLNPENP